MCDWRNELNVTHALTANDAAGDFHTAFVADNALVADAFVLTAVTFVILFRTEDLFIEKTVLLRTLGAVVDGLRLRDLALAPRENALRTRKRETESSPILAVLRHARNEILFWCDSHRDLVREILSVVHRLNIEREAADLVGKNTEGSRRARMDDRFALHDCIEGR